MFPLGVINLGKSWSSQKENLSKEDPTLKAVKRILNKLTLENYVRLKHQLMDYYGDAEWRCEDVSKGIVSLIVDKAVSEPTSCSICAMLCLDLHYKFRPNPLAEVCDNPKEFKELLLDSCQEAFEGAGKSSQTAAGTEQRLGSIRLIGELLKQKMVSEKFAHRIARELFGDDDTACPQEDNIEAICLLFSSAGKRLDKKRKSERIVDSYFNRLCKLYPNTNLPSRLRFMVRDVLDLRSNDWVPRPEEAKAKRPRTEIHVQGEKNPILGSAATSSSIVGLNPDELKKKTASLLEEYFSVGLLDRALQCIEELRSPSHRPEVVKEAILHGLEKSPPMVENVADLLEYLLRKQALGPYDVSGGCAHYATLLESLAIDMPKAPLNFGLIVGKLVLVGGLDFGAVRDIISKFYSQRCVGLCDGVHWLLFVRKFTAWL